MNDKIQLLVPDFINMDDTQSREPYTALLHINRKAISFETVGGVDAWGDYRVDKYGVRITETKIGVPAVDNWLKRYVELNSQKKRTNGY